MKDFSMYRYFKGEKENPFENKKEVDYRFCIAAIFWFYESHFEGLFAKNESSAWLALFGSKTSEKFMKLLSEEDYERPTEKKKAVIFELWLYDYLFPDKLCDWGSMEEDIKSYLSTSAQQLQGL